MSATEQRNRSVASAPASITSRAALGDDHTSFMRRRVPFLFSVRFGLTAWYAGVLILTLALSGIALRTMLLRSLDQDADARLYVAATDVRAQVTERTGASEGEGRLGASFLLPNLDVRAILLSGVSVTIVDTESGLPLYRGGVLADVWPTREDIAEHLHDRETRYITETVAEQAIRGLAYPIISRQAIDPETGHRQVIGMIFTAESLEGRNRVLDSLNRVLVIAGVAGVAIASYVGWLLAGRALAPVNRIMTSADAIAKGKGAVSLSRRIDVPRTGDEIAQLAVTFNDMLDRIEAAFAAQRRFVGDASHELRTPLTSIKGNVDVLRRQIASLRRVEPEEVSEALAEVHRETDRMGRLVDDLLALARTDAEGLGSLVTRSPVALDLVAQEAARTAEALVKGQEFVLHAPQAVRIEGDRDRLVQVILILLDNAFRHTPAGEKVTLSISTATDPEEEIPCARIEVSDTGRGIAPEHLPHLFERFYRAEGSRSRTDGGTGLGLSIALAIVRSHDGWIDVESAPGRGTRFTVWIPLPTPVEDAAPAAPERGATRRLPLPRFVRFRRSSSGD